MVTNARSHSIDLTHLMQRGVVAGILSAIISGAIAMIAGQLLGDSHDLWTFPKVVSTLILGADAAQPLAGFAAGPVVFGLALHLLIGGFFGGIFAAIVGFLDVDDVVAVMLCGLVYAAVIFLFTYVFLAQLLFPTFQDLPLIVAFWNHVIFGIVAGLLLANWHRRYDAGPVATSLPAAVSRPESWAFYATVTLVGVAAVTALVERGIDFSVGGIALMAGIAALLALTALGTFRYVTQQRHTHP